MNRFKNHSLPFVTLALAALSGLLISDANAERIFYDSFEVVDSAGYPVGWIREGHPSYISAPIENAIWQTPYGVRGMSNYASGIATQTVGYISWLSGPEASGDYIVKFNITSSAPIGEYRAELWAIPFFGAPILVGHAAGDTDGSKNMSFARQITWRYNHGDWLAGGWSTMEGAALQLKLMQDPERVNWQHTPIWDNVSVDWLPDVDTTGPTVVDIVDDKPGASVLATDSVVTYTVTFNEPMDANTVGVSDFGNAGSSNVTIVSVTPTSNAAVFLVGVTPTSEGTLRLRIAEGADLRDTAGNSMAQFPLVLDDVTFIVEAGTPILLPSDIVDDRGGSPMTVNTPVTYTLTFSKDMNASTVSAADFGNAGTAPITIGTPTETTPGVFTVEVTPTGAGTLQFKVNSGVVIQAADGGSLNTSSAIADDTTLVVDSVRPTLTEIIDDTDGNPVAVGTLVIYEVIFSEDMNAATVDASDFGNALTTGNAPFTIDSVAEASSGVFRIEITPTGVGSIQLQINAGAILKDVAGNDLTTTVALLDDTSITVQSSTADPFGDWAGLAAFGDDENGDGVANGLAWVLGASSPDDAANGLLPTLDAKSDPDFVIFTFRRKDDANADLNTVIAAQYGTTMAANDWETAIDDGTDIIITEDDNFHSADPGIDRVVVKLRKSVFAQNGRLFVRLGVSSAQ